METEIDEDEKQALIACKAWDNVMCVCGKQATHDDRGYPLRGQPFYAAYCRACLRSQVRPAEELASAQSQRNAGEREGRRAKVFAAVNQERARQDAKWGGPEHDRRHTISDWVSFINEHADKARVQARIGNLGEAQRRLLEVAALAVAALEFLDEIDSYTQG